MAEVLTPDICVVGGGPGGIAAALTAASAGVPVVLVERSRLGGSDLASGSVPSKALLAAAGIYEALRQGPAFGVTGAPLQVTLPKVREHIDSVAVAVAARLSAERLTALGVTVVAGAARFIDRRTVIAGDVTIRARRFILAVGSVPITLQIPGLETVDYMTPANGVFDMARKPAHLLVLGAGPYALELAQAHNRLGIDTTVLSDGPALADSDPELAAVVVNRLRTEGIRVRINLAIASVFRRKGGIRFLVEDPEAESEGAAPGEIAVDGSHLLVVAGRQPDIANLGLAAAGIAHNDDGIVVDRHLRTANGRVYAIGDAIGGSASAVRAEYQAECAVKSILYRWRIAADAAAVPLVAWTDPALASVGLSENEARKQHGTVRTLRMPFVDNDRAAIERSPAGMLKVIATPRGRIVGAAIVGRDAAELIAPWSLAVANRSSLSAMAAPWPPYPSRSAIARRLARLPEAGLTPPWRKRIIDLLRKFG